MIDAPRVSVDDLKQRLHAGEDVVVLDMRRASYHSSDVKIPGAIRTELEDLSAQQEQLSRQSSVVSYCTCSNEATSARGAKLLTEQGFDAAALAGGFEAWEEAGYPTQSKDA